MDTTKWSSSAAAAAAAAANNGGVGGPMQLTSNGPAVNPAGFQPPQQQQQPPKLGTSNSVPGVLNVPSSVAAVNASSSSGGSPNEWNSNSVFNANRVLHSIILLLFF